jgi:hypothetical protein
LNLPLKGGSGSIVNLPLLLKVLDSIYIGQEGLTAKASTVV